MRLFKRWISILICFIFVCTSCSCSNTRYQDPLAAGKDDNTIDTWVPLLTEEQYAEYGIGTYVDTPSSRAHYYQDSIYYEGIYSFPTGSGEESSIYTMMRYDMRSGKSYPACRDSACTHLDESCVFYNTKGIVTYIIQDDTMYYITAKTNSKGEIMTDVSGAIHSYNLSTLKYKYLTEWEPAVGAAGLKYYNGCLYFTQYEIHKNDNNYDKSIWSYNLKNGKKEKLFTYGDRNDTDRSGCMPGPIDEKGRMIFIHLPEDFDYMAWNKEYEVSFTCRELKKNAEEEILIESFSTKFSIISLSTKQYIDNKMIFQVQEARQEYQETLEDGEYTNSYVSYSIMCADLETGEITKLIENTCSGFMIAGKYIYYLPLKPEVVVYEDDEKAFFQTRGKIIQYDVQTGAQREITIAEDGQLSFSIGYYYRGRFFCIMTNPKQGRSYTIELDVSTGEYRVIEAGIIQRVLA